MDIRRGNTVVILSGKDKGKQGTVERVLTDTHEVVVAGVNIAKRHIKPNSKFPAGGIIEIAQPMSQSKVKVVEGDAEKTEKKPKSAKKSK